MNEGTYYNKFLDVTFFYSYSEKDSQVIIFILIKKRAEAVWSAPIHGDGANFDCHHRFCYQNKREGKVPGSFTIKRELSFLRQVIVS
jgi:hypothetical protein